jgi:hypothetical protein
MLPDTATQKQMEQKALSTIHIVRRKIPNAVPTPRDGTNPPSNMVDEEHIETIIFPTVTAAHYLEYDEFKHMYKYVRYNELTGVNTYDPKTL